MHFQTHKNKVITTDCQNEQLHTVFIQVLVPKAIKSKLCMLINPQFFECAVFGKKKIRKMSTCFLYFKS